MNAGQPYGHTSLYSDRYIESSGIKHPEAGLAGSREHIEGLPPLLLADGLAAIRTEFSPVCDHETVPLPRATGRALVDALISPADLPSTDLSAVDGYGALSEAAHDCDLLVTSGGMSVGREDHVRSIIDRGTLDVWPVAIKPGRPVGLGDIDTCPILALPGNPIAAVVAFAALGRSVVNVLSGAVDAAPTLLSLPAGFVFEKKTRVRQFLLAELSRGDADVTIVVPCERQGTAMLSTLGATSGFIVLAEDRLLVRYGSPVEFLPMSTLLH